MFRQLRFILACSLLISVSAPPAQTHRRLKTISIRVQEGTTLGFDISPDNRSIVFDLLGQLWLLPAQGGKARPLTDAVRDTAEDLDPSFSPDGRRVIFRGERNGRTGLWLMDLDSRALRQLTQLADPDGYDGNAVWSPDGRVIAFVHFVPPASAGSRWRPAIMLLDVASGSVHELSITGIQNPRLRDPVWVRGGREIAFVESKGKLGGRVWIVDAKGGQATPVTNESVQALAPAFSADGRRMAYFASDSAGRTQVWVQEITNSVNTAGPPIQITNHADVTLTRIRWVPDTERVAVFRGRSIVESQRVRRRTTKRSPLHGRTLLHSSRARDATCTVSRTWSTRGRERFHGTRPFTGRTRNRSSCAGQAVDHTVGATPRAIASVPFEATSLAWSPDGSEVAWSAGVADHEDLFATNLKTGANRQITSLPGREIFPTYSPDGRHLAFVHAAGRRSATRD